MSLTVQCSQCKSNLDLDDGFRGGVCRCSSCGTLIQVPRSSEEGVARGARPARPAGNASGTGAPERGSGDFGGSSSGLRGPRPIPNVARPATAVPPPAAATSIVPVERLPAESPSVAATVRKNKARRWIGIMLLIVIAAIVAWGILFFTS